MNEANGWKTILNVQTRYNTRRRIHLYYKLPAYALWLFFF